MATIELAYAPLSLFNTLSRMFFLAAKEYGDSVLVLEHLDPDKVWLMSFDTNRYDIYQALGINVGERSKKGLKFFCNRQPCFSPYDVFECEYLISGCDVSENSFKKYYLALYRMWASGDYRNSQLATLVYEFQRTGFDWSFCNVLIRPFDGALFLSDVLFDTKMNICPWDIYFDSAQFDWIESLYQ